MTSAPSAPARPAAYVRKPAHNGHVVYDGLSLIDGQRIVVVLTGLRQASENVKTGAMLQTYILRADATPLAALASGADVSVCGDCPHRSPASGGAGTCYVNVGQGPQVVWRAWMRGKYPAISPRRAAALVAGRSIRVGSYGDPAAVPSTVWRTLIRRASSHTGYTHQWAKARARHYRSFLMASADTAAQQQTAREQGWRVFRVKTADSPRLPGEILCPASIEAGKRRTCETCSACDGAGTNSGRASVVIDAHGLGWKVRRFALTVV